MRGWTMPCSWNGSRKSSCPTPRMDPDLMHWMKINLTVRLKMFIFDQHDVYNSSWFQTVKKPAEQALLFMDHLRVQKNPEGIGLLHNVGVHACYGPRNKTETRQPIDAGHLGACLKSTAKNKWEEWLQSKTMSEDCILLYQVSNVHELWMVLRTSLQCRLLNQFDKSWCSVGSCHS